MIRMPAHVTVIKCRTLDVDYTNLVFHECSLGEFRKDIQEEIRRFCSEGTLSEIDIFWHLNGYCEKKYGPCHWQVLYAEAGRLTF